MGSAKDETYDQLLESVLVGPINVGNYRFILLAIFGGSSYHLFLLDLCMESSLTYSFVGPVGRLARPIKNS